MNRLGYLIVLGPAVNVDRFESSQFVQDNLGLYREFRQCFSRFDPRQYRGISREPLDGYLSTEERQSSSLVANWAARLRLSEIIPETTPHYYDDSFIDRIESAQSIYNLLEDQPAWEIIEISCDAFVQKSEILGFDVGYWGGDHFSLIADTVVTPTWHPPHPDDYAEIIGRLSVLNQHLLFSTASEAADYKAYYKSKPWAETEDKGGEFSIIQVRVVSEKP